VKPPLTAGAWLRYDAIMSALDGAPEVRSILEVGCGLGALGARLARRFDYTAVERDERSASVARSRIEPLGGRVVTGDIEQLGDAETFDAVCAFEVLEHVDDDGAALAAWRARLSPRGLLVLSVPAFQRRFAPWDAKVGHLRRYEPDALARLVEGSGFTDVRWRLHGFVLGEALEAVRNRIAARQETGGTTGERTAASARVLQPPAWLGPATWLATAPFRLVQRTPAGAGRGIGIVVGARRDD